VRSSGWSRLNSHCLAKRTAVEQTFDIGWTGGALATVAGEFEPGGEVRLHGTFGPATAMDGSAPARRGQRKGYGSGELESCPARACRLCPGCAQQRGAAGRIAARLHRLVALTARQCLPPPLSVAAR